MIKLSKPQQAIYEMDRCVGGSAANISGDIFFPQEYNTAKMVVVCKELIHLNPILKTRVVLKNNVAMQMIEDMEDIDIETSFFPDEETYKKWAVKEAIKPIDIWGSLTFLYVCSIKEKGIYIYVKLHHIISDAGSYGVIAEHLHKIYIREEVPVFSYQEYLLKEQEYLKSEKYIKDKEYWLAQYENNNEIHLLSTDKVSDFSAYRKSVTFPRELSDKVKGFCSANTCSEFSFFVAVFSVWIYRINGKNNFYIGTPILNRVGRKEKSTIGTYINTIPLAIQISDDDNFQMFWKKIVELIVSGFRHQKLLYSDFLKILREEKGLANLLFDVVISFQNMQTGSYETNWYFQGRQAESLQIHIDQRTENQCYRINYDYQINKFSETQIDRLHSNIMSLYQKHITMESISHRKMCLIILQSISFMFL